MSRFGDFNLRDFFKQQGHDFVASDGSVEPMDFRTQSENSPSVPRHRFRDLIELNAPLVEQITDSTSAVATLTKKQADKKVSDSVALVRNASINRSTKQLDRLVSSYKSKFKRGIGVSGVFTRFMAMRLSALLENYQSGDFDIYRDWGQYRISRKEDEISFSRLSQKTKKPVYQLSLKIDNGFKLLDIETLSSPRESFIIPDAIINKK